MGVIFFFRKGMGADGVNNYRDKLPSFLMSALNGIITIYQLILH